MGQTLSEPVTAKETTSCSNDDYAVGASCMQGWRISRILFNYLYFYLIYLLTDNLIITKSNVLIDLNNYLIKFLVMSQKNRSIIELIAKAFSEK
jgi:hypothetical protein